MELIRQRKVKLGMDLAPLIDVVFQLLIFFMLTTSFANPTIQLNLPRAVTQDSTQPEKIVMSVQHNGEIFINGRETSLERLAGDLKLLLKTNSSKSVFIKGDENMAYKYFVQVMDIARQSGAEQIHIVHQGNP